MGYDVSGFGVAPESGEGLAGALPALERKFVAFDTVAEVEGGVEINGYASLFGAVDQGGDVVEAGAYGASLKAVGSEEHTSELESFL